jgi:hypothetical protein
MTRERMINSSALMPMEKREGYSGVDCNETNEGVEPRRALTNTSDDATNRVMSAIRSLNDSLSELCQY